MKAPDLYRRRLVARLAGLCLIVGAGLLPHAARALPGLQRQITELQFQYGRLNNTAFLGGGISDNAIITLQHASGWTWGDVFLFVDFQNFRGNVHRRGGSDIYAEYYAGLSLGKISRRRVGFGPIRDMGPRLGLNQGADPNILKLLPGWRFALEAPGFRYLNWDIYAFLDFSGGLKSGGAPKQTDTWQTDINWARPFSIGGHNFSFEGHIEFTPRRRNELGGRVSWTILSQPQLRWDIGRELGLAPRRIFIGIEPQFFINKLGDPTTSEYAVQALLVWRL